ncbi:unnamed protein product [Rotaria sp. Silwood1]|nr:unnamed protein product [Rotaria sp. Silwood1]
MIYFAFSAWPCSAWDQNPVIITGTGSFGSGSNQLNEPRDVAIDNYFNIYVSDAFNHRIQKYINGSTSGITLTSGGGSGPSQVNYPTGLWIDPDGNLYVTDYFNCRVMKYNNISFASLSIPIVGQAVAGGSCGTGLNQLKDPVAVLTDDLRNVYVCENGNNRVTRWAPGSTSGTVIAGIGNGATGNGTNGLSCPFGFHLDSNSTLYIADSCNHRIQKWLSGASTGITVTAIGYPLDVLVDSYGIMYVSSGGTIHRFYPNSTSGTIVASVALGTSFGFKFDAIGNLYVTEYYTGVLKKFNLVSTACVPLSWYGVQRNVDLSTLSNDWSECYRGTYAVALNETILTSILNACNKGQLLLACRPVNTSLLTVAAMGLRADVLFNCSSSSSCTHAANGVGWYYSNNYSWGFVSNNDTVSRNPCDTTQANPSYGLCWYTGQLSGGLQCGANILSPLNYTNFERIIYHS